MKDDIEFHELHDIKIVDYTFMFLILFVSVLFAFFWPNLI